MDFLNYVDEKKTTSTLIIHGLSSVENNTVTHAVTGTQLRWRGQRKVIHKHRHLLNQEEKMSQFYP